MVSFVGYGFAHGVTLRIAAFIVAANVVSMAASWISLKAGIERGSSRGR